MTHKTTTYDMKRTAELVGIGKLKLFKILRDTKVFNPDNLPYIQYREKGYFKIKTSTYVHDVRGVQARNSTVVTPLGIEFISALLNDYLDKSEQNKKPPARIAS